MGSLRPVAFVLGMTGLLAAGPPPAAAETQDNPGIFLRVENGAHQAVVNRLALLPDGSAVVSGSDDKTARLWSTDDLAARGVIRPPMGLSETGQVYAVATSATRIAVAGSIRDAAGRIVIRQYATSDLHPLQSIGPIPKPVLALRYAPSGGELAIGMQDGGGLLLADVSGDKPKPLFADADYKENLAWIDYEPGGTFAAVATDGKLRLYDRTRRLASVALPGKATPWSVAFAPGGQRIAIGDRRVAAVHLFDVATQTFLRDVQGAPARTGALNVVAFAPDGATLYAGGTYQDAAGSNYILRWPLNGRGASEIAVAHDIVTDLVPLGDGILYATAEPAIGRIDARGRVVARRESGHIDFRDAGDTGFRISGDGAVIELPSTAERPGRLDTGRNRPSMLYDVVAREFLARATAGPKLARPFASAAGTSVTEWKNSRVPRVNGHLVALDPNENARAAAVMPDGAAVAIGSDFYVRMVGKTGEEIWRQDTQAPAWAVNVSGDGRLAVAALGDGTVHWYRAARGGPSETHELLVLYVDPATRRWVLSTPDGYFDHDHRADGKPDGRSLIGFQVNPVPKSAGAFRHGAFVEVGQLYPLFFRPDLVGQSFRDDPLSRQTIADQKSRLGSVAATLEHGLPPSVTMVSACAAGDRGGCPASGPGSAPPTSIATTGTTATVTYRLAAANGPLGHAIIRRNGAVIAPPLTVADQAPDHRTETAEIALGIGANDIAITPVNPNRDIEGSDAASAHIVLNRTLAMRGVPASERGAAAEAPPAPTTLFVLSVGVSRSLHPSLSLANPANDATAFADMMQVPTPPVYDRVVASPPLLDQDATTDNILAALRNIADHATADDLVVIFFAGHGTEIDGKYYFGQYDIDPADADLARRAFQEEDAHAMDEVFRTAALSQDQILPIVRAIKAARVAIVLDTCYSSTLSTEDSVRRDRNSTVTNGLGHAGGRFVLSSAIERAADAGTGEEHGLFTSYMLRALSGEADFDKTHRIDIYKLATYTQREVVSKSRALGSVQHPEFYFAGNQFFDLRAVPAGP